MFFNIWVDNGSMADVRIRKRKRLREKEIDALAADLKAIFGVDTFSAKDVVDTAESSDFDLVFVKNDILAMIYEGKPFLTVRGLLKYKPQKKFVTVDMGAVPYVTNGADIMGPGIVDCDSEIKEGDMVWIKDVKNQVPLAVGITSKNASSLKAKEKGKAIKTLHYVGDKLWKTGE